jgi:nucleotide-binding universal stress UspA family protein
MAANRDEATNFEGNRNMAPRIIVSYDDTDNDRDALALGRLLGYSGAQISLAYVRHSQLEEGSREAEERRQAEELLARGAASIGAAETPRHVVIHGSTGEGLLELAEREAADIVVFGSDYRTAPGSVQPGTTARRLLTGGSVAVAVAPADLRSRSAVSVNTIGVLDEGDDAARATAESLAAALGASLRDGGRKPLDLLVAGSRPETPRGRVMLSAANEYEIETATCPVLVTPRGTGIRFTSSDPEPRPEFRPEPAVSA